MATLVSLLHSKDKSFLSLMWPSLQVKFSNLTPCSTFSPIKIWQCTFRIYHCTVKQKSGVFLAAFFSDSPKSLTKSVFSIRINTQFSSFLKINLWFNCKFVHASENCFVLKKQLPENTELWASLCETEVLNISSKFVVKPSEYVGHKDHLEVNTY